MKLEYRNGVRLTMLVHEMDPLEAAIHNYEKMAKEHFSLENAEKTTYTEAQRKEKLEESLKFLQLERIKLKTIASVQAQLQVYREQGLQAKTSRASLGGLEAEDHHPTEDLEKYMRAEGQVKPSQYHTAHHIVPGKGKLKVLTSQTRTHLHINGIRINDPANGVYLLHKDEYTTPPHWSMPNSRGHLKYHTYDYERWVSQKITPLWNIDQIKTTLQLIGRLLQDNEPKSAISAIKNLG